MSKHKHADLMMQYAQDAMETDKPWERWEFKHDNNDAWEQGIVPFSWWEDSFYRRIDPYRHLKEAQERGEVIEHNVEYYNIPRGEKWLPNSNGDFSFCYHVDSYRIKPKEKKRLYLYAWLDRKSGSWKLADRFFNGDDDYKQDYLWANEEGEFKRIDSSMIEVES